VKVTLAAACAALLLMCGAAQADVPMTVEHAEAVAKAINLTTADMVGYEAQTPDQVGDIEGPSAPSSGGGADCGEVSGPPVVGDFTSDVFSTLDPSASDFSYRMALSDVTVFRSASQAQRQVAAFVSKRSFACIRRQIAKSKDPDIKKVKFTIKRLRAGVPGAVGIRIRGTLHEKRETINFYSDVFAFARGPVAVALSTSAFPAQFGSGRERRLLQLLNGRAIQQIPAPNLAPGAPNALPG
jgi:hypothetical protein